MKNIRRSLLAAAAVAAGLSFLTPAASAREMALGLNGGYASYNDGGYASVSFQVDLVPHVRLAPEIGYAFRSEGKSAFLLSADVQFPFRLARGFNIYPLAGLTLNSWSYRHHDSATRVGADMGGGFEVFLTSNLKLSVQAKYSLMSDTGGAFAGFGIHYVF